MIKANVLADVCDWSCVSENDYCHFMQKLSGLMSELAYRGRPAVVLYQGDEYDGQCKKLFNLYNKMSEKHQALVRATLRVNGYKFKHDKQTGALLIEWKF